MQVDFEVYVSECTITSFTESGNVILEYFIGTGLNVTHTFDPFIQDPDCQKDDSAAYTLTYTIDGGSSITVTDDYLTTGNHFAFDSADRVL